MKPNDISSCALSPRIIHEEFDNGLRVFLLPSGESETVSVQAWVETGSMHEGEFLGCGLSHFLEHMLFAGTEKYPGTGIADTVNRFGGELNAYTSYGSTVYYMNLPSANLSDGIDMLDSMLRTPLFPEERFLLEKDVILRECSMYKDRPDSVLFENLWKTVFLKHPMRHPVIGYESRIKQVDRPMMHHYFTHRYTPGRTFYVIAGKLDPKKTLSLLREKTASWECGSLTEFASVLEGEQTMPRCRTDFFNDPLCRAGVAWRIPEISHKDIPAIDIFTMILGADASSRLYKALRTDAELALNVSSFSYGNSLGGAGGFMALAMPGKMEELTGKALDIIRDLQRKKVGMRELDRAVTRQTLDYLRSMRSNSSLARLVGGSVLALGTADGTDLYLEQLRKITADDILQVANEYFSTNAFSLAELLPEDRKNVSVGKKRLCSGNKKQPSMSRLPDGERVIYLHDGTLPLIDMTVVLPGGTLWEPAEQRGISKLLAECLPCGNRKYNEDELNELLDNHGIDFSVTSGNNVLVLKMNCGKEHFRDALCALCATLESPLFTEKVFRRERESMMEALKSRENEPRQRADDTFCSLLYREHPYGCPAGATNEALNVITRKDLRNYYGSVLRPELCCMAISGDLSEKEAAKAAERIAEAMRESRGVKMLKLPDSPVFKQGTLSETVYLEKEQAVVLYGMPSLRVDSQDLPAMELFQYAVNTMSSALFKSIREENALAYYTGMRHVCGMHEGYLAYYAGTHSDAVDRVLELFELERKRIVDHGLDVQEFESAKAAVLFSLEDDAGNSGATASLAALSEFYGTGFMMPFEKAEKIRKLTRKAVNRVLAKVLSSPLRVIAVVQSPKKSRKI